MILADTLGARIWTCVTMTRQYGPLCCIWHTNISARATPKRFATRIQVHIEGRALVCMGDMMKMNLTPTATAVMLTMSSTNVLCMNCM